MAYIVVISGLSGAGKTTLTNALLEKGRELVPSTSTMRRNRNEFPDISSSREDTLKKQTYYLELDKIASKIAFNIYNHGRTAICDRDFLSALAHNYAIDKTDPSVSVYSWMVQHYVQALQKDDLIVPDYHIFLDIPLTERKKHAEHEKNRERDNCFFDQEFCAHYINFFRGALRCMPSLWLASVPDNFSLSSLNIDNATQDRNQSKSLLIQYLTGTTDDRCIDHSQTGSRDNSR